MSRWKNVKVTVLNPKLPETDVRAVNIVLKFGGPGHKARVSPNQKRRVHALLKGHPLEVLVCTPDVRFSWGEAPWDECLEATLRGAI